MFDGEFTYSAQIISILNASNLPNEYCQLWMILGDLIFEQRSIKMICVKLGTYAVFNCFSYQTFNNKS